MFPGFIFYQPYGIICEVGSNAEASDISPQVEFPLVTNSPYIARPDDGVHPVLPTCLAGQISDPYGGAEVGIANPEQGIQCMRPLAESIITGGLGH